jgi:zinc protease
MHCLNVSPRRFFTVIGALAITASPLALIACTPKADVSDVTRLETQSDLKPDPALVTGTLDNGLRYAVLRNQTPPGTGALRVQFDSGSLNELPGTEGLAHYLEHMAFNGSKNVPEGEMIQMLERLGLSFGADTNASTGFDRTIYKLNLPTLDQEVLDAAFMLMAETAYNLTLDQDAIERELGIILSEKRTRDTAGSRLTEARLRFFTGGSDLMDRLPIGTDESLNAITAPDFRAYYEAHYHPEKTFVAFVGDKDPQEIVTYIEKTFGDWEPETSAADDIPPTPATEFNNRVGIHVEDGLGTNVSLVALRPYIKREDSSETRRERLIRAIAPSLMGQRMRAIAERPDRPFIGASMSSLSLYEVTEGMSFSAYTNAEDWDEALRGIETELRKALEFGFTQAELDAHMARLQSSYEARDEGADTRSTNGFMGSGLIDTLMRSYDNERVFMHPKQSLEWFNSIKDSIDLETVNTDMREAWGDLDDLSVFMATDTSIDVSESDVRSVLADSRKTEVVADDRDKLATEFAYTDFGSPGKIVSDVYKTDIDAYLIKFENNVRLNFKQTDFDDDRVNVHVEFGDGNLSTPRKDEGLRRMVFGIMGASGFEAHMPSEIQRLMAGKLVAMPRLRNVEDSDTFSIIAQTVPENFRDQLNLFTAVFVEPGFRDVARTNHIDKMKAWYPRHDKSMQDAMAKELKRILHNGDKRFGFDNEEMFYSPTLAEVENWLTPQLKKGLIEITVVGDIDKDTVVQEIAATFGALSKRDDTRGEYPEMRDVNFPAPQDDPFTIFHRDDDNQAQLRIYWPASDGMDVTYARQLSVLRAILRNRLVKEIREGAATTYSPGASSRASTVFPDYGYIMAVLTLKPEDIAPMTEKVMSITQDMAADSLTEDEFNRAIKPMLERLKSSDKRNSYWVSILSDAQTEGMGLKRHLTRESDLQNMTVADVQALAKEVFKAEKAIEIHVLPAEES